MCVAAVLEPPLYWLFDLLRLDVLFMKYYAQAKLPPDRCGLVEAQQPPQRALKPAPCRLKWLAVL